MMLQMPGRQTIFIFTSRQSNLWLEAQAHRKIKEKENCMKVIMYFDCLLLAISGGT
jgi:hypothetical protein